MHLHLHSPYSFLDGASPLEDLVRAAAHYGMPALALTDHDNTAAAVKFTALCDGYGVRPILGSEVTLEDGSHLTLLAQGRAGYATLCSLLSMSYAVGGRLTPRLPWNALFANTTGLICLSGCRKGLTPALIRVHRYADAQEAARRLREAFGRDRFYLELQEDRDPDAHRVCKELALLARHLDVGVVATHNVHYLRPEDFITHDILRAIATHTGKEEVHPDRPLNSQRHFKSPQEMAALFEWCPEALANTLRIAEACEPALPHNEEITPRFSTPQGQEAGAYLRHLAYKGAKARYRTLTPRITARIDHELGAICTLGFADYVLMVWEIVRWARKQGIRATGRGSAADSCVAYALTLTDVDVIARDLPFARFLTPGKTPDIDMDFPSDRRDDVFRYIIGKYGADHVGMVCTFHTFWARSAVRDVAKAIQLPPEALEPLAHNLSHFLRADAIDAAFERYAELKPYARYKERYRLLLLLCERIAGFPRHMGTHSSGVVISRVPLATLAPITPSARGLTQIWMLDKDDAEAIGAIKFDVLSLRTLSALSDAEADLARTEPTFRYNRIPFDDEPTYRMIRSGKAVGSFQLESPAQMALATTLSPQHFEDLVASVALIRPGPIRGDAVRRFVAARNGWCRADVLHPLLIPVLAKTCGVIVFQEQVTQVLSLLMGCLEGEADRFRKGLAKHEKLDTMGAAREEFVVRATTRCPDLAVGAAHRVFDQIAGWGGYGFIEGHAASFALTGYKTAYLSVHRPAEYFAGLMNHQPMGYYNANTLAAEARRRGVRILPIDINASGDKSVADGTNAIQLGLRLTAELRAEDIVAILAARQEREFASLLDFVGRVNLHRDRLENLLLAGAFDRLHPHRRGLIWRLDETLALARTYRNHLHTDLDRGRGEPAVNDPRTVAPFASAGDNPTGGPAVNLPADGKPILPGASLQSEIVFKALENLPTPCADELDDFTLWDRFLWTWRITGVCADCHPLAYLRERLARRRVITAYEAQRQRQGERVTVAGLNISPHRPPTRSGRSVLFSSLEDETDLLQLICIGEALQNHTGLFLTAPAIVVRGVIERKGAGASLKVEQARPLCLRDYLDSKDLQPSSVSEITYAGTYLCPSSAF